MDRNYHKWHVIARFNTLSHKVEEVRLYSEPSPTIVGTHRWWNLSSGETREEAIINLHEMGHGWAMKLLKENLP